MQRLLQLSGKLGPLFALCLLIFYIGSAVPDKFFTFMNLGNIVGQTSVVSIAAIGMTFIIVSAGIDLSVGSAVALSGTFAAMAVLKVLSSAPDAAGVHPLTIISVAMLVGMTAGTIIGFISGFIITRCSLPPFIVTLGMMEIARGTILVATGGLPVSGMPAAFTWMGNANIRIPLDFTNPLLSKIVIPYSLIPLLILAVLLSYRYQTDRTLKLKFIKEFSISHVLLIAIPLAFLLAFLLTPLNVLIAKTIFRNPNPAIVFELTKTTMLIPYSLFLLIPLALLASFLLRNTVFGIQVYSIGSNEQTARLCGVNVERTKLLVYMLGGLTFGLAGFLHMSRLYSGQPAEAQGMELDVIAAVVVGGGSLMGGEGTIGGSIIGAFIIQLLRNGCNLMEVSSFMQRIFIGAIIIIAVLVDQLRRRAAAKTRNA